MEVGQRVWITSSDSFLGVEPGTIVRAPEACEEDKYGVMFDRDGGARTVDGGYLTVMEDDGLDRLMIDLLIG